MLWRPRNVNEQAAMYNHHTNITKIVKEEKCTAYQSIWWGHRGKVLDDVDNYVYNFYTGEVRFPDWAGFKKYPFAPVIQERFMKSNKSDYYVDGNYETCVEIDLIDAFDSQAYAYIGCRKEVGFKSCTSCFFPNTSQTGIMVRGLCQESLFNTETFLTIEQDKHGNLTYIGSDLSVIVYNEEIWEHA